MSSVYSTLDLNHEDGFTFGHHKAITHIEISPDGSYFVSTALDAKLKIWNTKKLNLRQTVKMTHKHMISSIAISPTSKSVAVGSTNGDITIIAACNGEVYVDLKHERNANNFDNIIITAIAYGDN